MKKRFVSLFMTLALCLSLLPAAMVPAGALEGSGTSGNPYKIGTAEELFAFAGIVNGGYTAACAVLTADVDLNNKAWTPIGWYAGTFDGQGNAITGLNVSNPQNADNRGLFNEIGEKGTVQNLIVSGTVAGRNYVGGIASKNSGTVKNCEVYVSVSGTDYVGGIVGKNLGSMTGCVSGGTVIDNLAGENQLVVTWTGGIVGYSGGTLTSCTNTATVSGGNPTGGIVGALAAGCTISDCVNSGAVSSNRYYSGHKTPIK